MTAPAPHGCTINGQPAMPILISEYHQLTAELAALRAVARGYCPACGRGDAAPTVADWEQQRQRADQAETALARIAGLADEYPVAIDTALIHAALDQPSAGAGQAATEATDGAWTPPPPGSTREQLPDQVLALLPEKTYLSTACETALSIEAAIVLHPDEDALPEWRDRMHQRCRLNHKFTGRLCHCRCHQEQHPA